MLMRSAASTLARRSAAATRPASRAFVSRTSPLLSEEKKVMYEAVPKADFGEYKEYSVIFTNRSLNLMSDPFQKVMRDLNTLLKATYNADKVAIIPGSGTFGMEAVARQFATNEHVMVIRNGWFSFRWTEIFDMGGENTIPKSHTVLKAQPVPTADPSSPHTHYAPYPIDEVVAKIHEEQPKVLFAPHVETSTGMILPDDYIKKAAAAMHEVGGLFVLDCIASGTVWADMKELGVDVVISAPQKGWTGPSCAALVMMSEQAHLKMVQTNETSFSISLKRWSAIMDTYENGGFGYHTTMPTDALRDFHEISVETMKFGIPELKQAQLQLGKEARALLESRALTSVAAPGFQAPGVLVYYSPIETANPLMMQRFKANGLQIAMGVPWRIDEPDGLQTFRLGLFGLDKMGNIPDTVSVLETALDKVLAESGHASAASNQAA
uniref:Aminotransferase class V domain-containing protein n=1 Tax=Attheya septentrionalis TaxID=420275 RepID=A0A7S2UJY5_9STRA|mmetsp:Transcript_26133/g.47418  ORF Transcript_26133/g.47418 Transcript_26133/m.47418 type:complete len:438 (+) Transcript_26133:63-1376(+)